MIKMEWGRLNPYFNGRYSQSRQWNNLYISQIVLILILMEDTLRADNGTISTYLRLS